MLPARRVSQGDSGTGHKCGGVWGLLHLHTCYMQRFFRFNRGCFSLPIGAGNWNRACKVCLTYNFSVVGSGKHIIFTVWPLFLLQQHKYLDTPRANTMHSFSAQQDRLGI